VRVVFNDGLRTRKAAHEAGLPYITDAELSARLTASKKTPERAWLGEVSSVPLQQSLADLNTAYKSYFDSVKGNRKGPKIGPPRLKSRKDRRQSARFTANARFKILPGRRLRLPGVGDVEVRWSRDLPSAPSSVTVINDAARTRLAKSIHDAGWTGFMRMLEYKAARYGRVFGKTGRFEPTSQVCSACGVKDGPKALNVREWACPACGTVHDRDVNAARNVLALGRRERINACGGVVRRRTALAVADEAGTRRSAA
jgi:transposase